MKIGRFLRTVRHLRPIQIFGRVWFKMSKPKITLSIHPAVRQKLGDWVRPAQRHASMKGRDEFLFLNEEGNLKTHGWSDDSKEKLWRYNQHYFDDLNAVGAKKKMEWHLSLIEHWIANNPVGVGTGWDSYPTSLRLVNWIKWSMAHGKLPETALQSLAQQTRWLEKRLEWHLLGNHLFANAKALVFSGLFFEGAEAEKWLTTGTTILTKQMKEQILPDGGQFELSPMYHALAVEDVLDLINVIRCYSAPGTEALLENLEQQIDPMLSWLAAMSHPDDRIAFFNDAAFGVAPDNKELRSYAHRLSFDPAPPSERVNYLDASGYVRLSLGPAIVIADIAEVGPSYLPGHAHADTLSFELSLFGQRLIVNSGTSVYGNGSERLRQRGTSAHSTVVLRNENSSEVWGGFRVGRRAYPRSQKVYEIPTALYAEAEHDGYWRLFGGHIHGRSWKLSRTELSITDHIYPAGAAEAMYHLHPDITVEKISDNEGYLQLPSGNSVRWNASAEVHLRNGNWHPEFGKSVPNQHLVANLVDGNLTMSFSWK